MKRRGFLLSMGVLGENCLAKPALATAHPTALSLRQVFDASEHVVSAVVGEPRSAWAEVFGARRIVTSWSIEVGRVLTGGPGARLEVATLGGTVGDVIQWVPHEATLGRSQPQLMFVRTGPLGRLWVTAMSQGAFRLVETASEPRVYISPQQLSHDAAGSIVRTLSGASLDEVNGLVTALGAS